MVKVNWGIPKVQPTGECHFTKIATRKEGGSVSEVVMGFHYIDEETALKIYDAIANHMEDEKAKAHAELFSDLRKISPGDLYWQYRILSRFSRFLPPKSIRRKIFLKLIFAPAITWADYGKKVYPGWSSDDFIDYYNGLTYKVIKNYLDITQAIASQPS